MHLMLVKKQKRKSSSGGAASDTTWVDKDFGDTAIHFMPQIVSYMPGSVSVEHVCGG
jgi:hypothetical protein